MEPTKNGTWMFCRCGGFDAKCGYGCDGSAGTQQLNKNETSTVANVGAGNAGGFGAMCALAMPWLGVACLTYGLAIWNTAVHARDTGQCLGIQYVGTGMQVVWPVTYSGPNCK